MCIHCSDDVELVQAFAQLVRKCRKRQQRDQRVLKAHPTLTAAEAIEHLDAAGGL
jgi:hypothetical protein